MNDCIAVNIQDMPKAIGEGEIDKASLRFFESTKYRMQQPFDFSYRNASKIQILS